MEEPQIEERVNYAKKRPRLAKLNFKSHLLCSHFGAFKEPAENHFKHKQCDQIL